MVVKPPFCFTTDSSTIRSFLRELRQQLAVIGLDVRRGLLVDLLVRSKVWLVIIEIKVN